MGRTASTRDYLADAGRGVKLEEEYNDGQSILKYRSYDGSEKFVQASNTPEGGGNELKVGFTVNSPFSTYSWEIGNSLTINKVYEFDDIEIVDGADVSNTNVLRIGDHTIAKAGSFWVCDNVPIEGSTGETIISDPVIFDKIKELVKRVRIFSILSNSSLSVFRFLQREMVGKSTFGEITMVFPTAEMVYPFTRS